MTWCRKIKKFDSRHLLKKQLPKTICSLDNGVQMEIGMEISQKKN